MSDERHKTSLTYDAVKFAHALFEGDSRQVIDFADSNDYLVVKIQFSCYYHIYMLQSR